MAKTKKKAAGIKITQGFKNAYQEALALYAHRDDVTGIGVGFKYTNGKTDGKTLAIRIHVKEKVDRKKITERELFKDKINRKPTDVMQFNYRRQEGSYNSDPIRTRVWQTLQPGISVGHQDSEGCGTLGMFVKDNRAGAPCILSVAHVLAPPPARPGQLILQPGPGDQGMPGHEVATLARYNRETDSAIAILNDIRSYKTKPYRKPSSQQIEFSGVRDPLLKEVLYKSGRTTGITKARVDCIGTFGGLSGAFQLVPVQENWDDIEISYKGDSGAVWYSQADHKAVGLHCDGEKSDNRFNECAVAVKLTHVFTALDISML